MTTDFRCSSASRDVTESIEGTASTVRSFVLVENSGPWGVEALRDARVDDEVKRRLRSLEAGHGIRPLLIRRHGGGPTRGARIFAAHVHRDRPWMETAQLGDLRELLDLDLPALAAGRSVGLAPHADPVFLVCTHGRHDRCCAVRGRPLAAALAEAAPGQAWEVSHIGGDRFAPNLLVLPHGLYYGRLATPDVPALVAAHVAGRLDIEHLRGRSAYPFPVQAAEIYLRRHLGLVAIQPLPLQEHGRHSTESRAVFLVDGQRWAVRVRSELGQARRLTCSAPRPSRPLAHLLLSIERA